jgi:hypothetical protein
VKGTTVALIALGVAVVGGGGYFIYQAHVKATAAAAAAAKASAGSSKGSNVAKEILSIAPAAITLGQKIANLF